jgi:hypothetical protein
MTGGRDVLPERPSASASVSIFFPRPRHARITPAQVELAERILRQVALRYIRNLEFREVNDGRILASIRPSAI